MKCFDEKNLSQICMAKTMISFPQESWMIRTIFVVDHTNRCWFATQRNGSVGLGSRRISDIHKSKVFWLRIRVHQVCASAWGGEVPNGFGVGGIIRIAGRIDLLADGKGGNAVKQGRSFGSGNHREESCCRHPKDCHRGHSGIHLASILQLHALCFSLLRSKFIKDITKNFSDQVSVFWFWSQKIFLHRRHRQKVRVRSIGRKRRFITDSYGVGPSAVIKFGPIISWPSVCSNAISWVTNLTISTRFFFSSLMPNVQVSWYLKKPRCPGT